MVMSREENNKIRYYLFLLNMLGLYNWWQSSFLGLTDTENSTYITSNPYTNNSSIGVDYSMAL